VLVEHDESVVTLTINRPDKDLTTNDCPTTLLVWQTLLPTLVNYTWPVVWSRWRVFDSATHGVYRHRGAWRNTSRAMLTDKKEAGVTSILELFAAGW